MISLYGRVEFILRNKILSGQFEAGERLPTEGEFTKQFGVSKVTVRQALAHLETNHLIPQKIQTFFNISNGEEGPKNSKTQAAQGRTDLFS